MHPVLYRGIFITGSSLLGAAIRVPRITSKNLIRSETFLQPFVSVSGPSMGTSPSSCVSCAWHEMLLPILLLGLTGCAAWRSIIFCEAVAIYGVIVAIILQTKIDYVDSDKTTGLYPIPAMTAGYAIFASGITTGWANLACGCDHLPVGLQSAWQDAWTGTALSNVKALVLLNCLGRLSMAVEANLLVSVLRQ